jgi:HEAT repeat protein
MNDPSSDEATRPDGDAEVLRQALESEDARNSRLRRHEIFDKLKRIDDESAVPPLCLMLERDDDPVLRASAAMRLAAFRVPAAHAALRAAANDPDGRVRSRALGGLGRYQDPADLGLLTAGLQDDDWAVRDLACVSLGELGDSRAVPALVEMLDDRKGSVRQVAARALVAIGGSAAAEALSSAANKSRFMNRLVLKDQARRAGEHE